MKKFWNGAQYLSKVLAVKWGREHEQDAIIAYSADYGPVKKCGLLVSKAMPFIAASPDGLQDDIIIEVKCPYVLRDTLPSNLESLEKTQLRSFFCEKVNGVLRLKKSHDYYGQVQTQMWVTGYSKTNFIV